MTQMNLSTKRKKNHILREQTCGCQGERKMEEGVYWEFGTGRYEVSYYHICLFAQSFLTVCDLMNCSPSGSSVHGILQARILEWVAVSFSRGSSQSSYQTYVSCVAGGLSTLWAIRNIEWLSNEVLFYSTGNCIKYSAIHH